MKDLLWTKGGKLRVLIATADHRLFDECKRIINHISAENSFKLQLQSLDETQLVKDPHDKDWSIYDLATKWGLIAGTPAIYIGEEMLWVDALAIEHGNPVSYTETPYEICAELTRIQEKDPLITRRAHIEQSVALYDPTADDIYAPTRQLWGTIALCEGMPLNYVRRGKFDTIFIPHDINGTLACNLKWKDIGRIAGEDSATTPLYRALRDIYFYLINRFQPF